MKLLDQVCLKAKTKFKSVGACTFALLSSLTIFTATTLSAAVSAQPTDGGGHRGPPPEALAACKTLASGAACSFTGGRGEAKGSCWAPEGKPLACKPKDAPQRDKQPVPQPKK